MDRLYYVDGACGSGKTTKALDWAIKWAGTGSRIIIAQPTTKLIDECFENASARCAALNVSVKRFDSATFPGEVYIRLDHFMKTCDPNCGHIVFITHKCLFDLPYWHGKDRWNLVIDEIPAVDSDFCFNLTENETQKFVTGNFEAIECGQNNYLELVVRSGRKATVEKWAKNGGRDQVLEVFADFYQSALSPYSKILVSRKSWRNLSVKGEGQIDIHAYRTPDIISGWLTCRIMGAMFTDSILAMLWGHLGVNFRPCTKIQVANTHHDKTVGKRVHIEWFSPYKWSKKRMQHMAEGYKLDDAIEKMHPFLETQFGKDPFLYVANVAVSNDAVESKFRAQRVSNSPYGLNCFRDYTNIAFLSALNQRPQHYQFMQDVFGILPYELANASSHQIAYQAIMRTDLRNESSTKKISVVVPHHDLAEWLAEVFPGCTIHGPKRTTATGQTGRPKQEAVLSLAERHKRNKAKKALLRGTKSTIERGLFVPLKTPAFTLETSVNAYDAGDFASTTHVDWNEVKREMKYLADNAIHKTKEDNVLMSGASFAPNPKSTTKKGLDDVSAVWGIWLDLEKGDLTPQDMKRIFADEKWFAHNSYNNAKDGTLRYHVVFPTTMPMTKELYHALWDALAARIKAFGYYIGRKSDYDKLRTANPHFAMKYSGLDKSKRCANTFMYLPCRAGLGRQHDFWIDNWDDKHMIDPYMWIDFVPEDEVELTDAEDYVNPSTGNVSPALKKMREALVRAPATATTFNPQTIIDAALADWLCTSPGEGNEGFFRLACRLKFLPWLDVEKILRQEANNAKHKSERMTQIKWIEKTFIKKGWKK